MFSKFLYFLPNQLRYQQDCLSFISPKKKMQLNPTTKQLDQSLNTYITSNDPLRKAASRTVFMKKKQLFTFYGNMQFKLNQELKLSQNQNNLAQLDLNKILRDHQKRKRQKIYSLTFYKNKRSSSTIHLHEKETINVNLKPIIFTQVSTPLKSKRQQEIKQRSNSKQESFIMQSVKLNQKLKCRESKSVCHNISIIKQPSTFLKFNKKNGLQSQKDLLSKESSEIICQKKIQLLELYQKLYHKFQAQKLQNTQTCKKLENKQQRKKLILEKIHPNA